MAAATGAGLVCSHAGGLRAADPAAPGRLRRRRGRRGRRRSPGSPTARSSWAYGRDGILIDPAHDFGKNTRHSLEITRRLDELVATGWPVLVALSNKDFVGETLDVPVDERLEGTLAATAVSAWLGARVFRAHQVRADPPGARHGGLDPRRPPARGRPPRPGLTGPAQVQRRMRLRQA